jgi:hypothetical protein
MPIVMIQKRGRYCPTIVCEVCQEPITEHGNVLYDPEQLERIYYVHKGRCNDVIEAQARPASLWWEELSWFLVYVANNAKLPPRTLVKREQWIKQVNI